MSQGDIVDSTGRVRRLTRNFGETDAQYAARLEMLSQSIEGHMSLDERIWRYDNLIPFPPRRQPIDLAAVYSRERKAKWSMMRITALRLENAGISEEAFIEHMKSHLGSEAVDVGR